MSDMGAYAGGIGAAIAVGIVMPILVKRQKKKLEGMVGMLRERGGMTLDELAQATNTGFWSKGYLMQALEQMVKEGKLTKTPPPPGHPRMRIVRDTKYSLPN